VPNIRNKRRRVKTLAFPLPENSALITEDGALAPSFHTIAIMRLRSLLRLVLEDGRATSAADRISFEQMTMIRSWENQLVEARHRHQKTSCLSGFLAAPSSLKQRLWFQFCCGFVAWIGS